LTDYSTFYKRFIDACYCTEAAADAASVRRARERLPGVPFTVIRGKDDIPRFARNQRTLFLTTGRGRAVDACPGSRGHLCCNYVTINLYEGCPIGCTYCIMHSYLNFLPVTINVDTFAIAAEIEGLVALNPGRPLRLGTGEVGDSLFYDPLFELSRDLIAACARHPNLTLELKTKTAFVDHLLAVEPKGAAVIGFSLNPQEIIDAEEGEAAGLEERLQAAGRALEAGFRLAFHFDPLIRVPGWEKLYEETTARLSAFPRESIAWISLGTIRYPKELKARLDEGETRPYLFDEFFQSRDGKFRYLQPVRERMYRSLAARLGRATDASVYLCMESPVVWKRVFGELPAKTKSLCAIFSDIILPPPAERNVEESDV
jgi:spore photoproduct lyase